MSNTLCNLPVSIAVLTDSYKAGHFAMYPDADKIVAYGEFRAGYDGDTDDTRFLFHGIRYIVENYVSRQWTMKDIEEADAFYSTHNAGYTPFPWPKDLFIKMVKENNGYFPVKIEALPEGTIANVHVPVYQVTAEKEYARLATFLETILTHVWYPTTVATLSRRTKDFIEEAFAKSVDDECNFLLGSRLHDFGFRGVSSVESAVVGGAAHLINFDGSDTMAACYYVQFHLNKGKPIGASIPATEHSIMTSWRTEREAILHMIEKFGDGLFACVLDSYDYSNCLNNIIPSIKEEKNKHPTGLMIFRPDSGDPVEAILMALAAADKTFGHTVNKKGFKVITGAAAIQGDGINYLAVKKILDATLAAGYSAQNVAFGMGGGLLQKINRDTMAFATKLSYIRTVDGKERDVMKKPKTDTGKTSLPGILWVTRVDGIPTVFPDPDGKHYGDAANLLQPVWNCGPVPGAFDYTFDDVRSRVNAEWHKVPATYDPVSAPLKDKIVAWIKDHNEFLKTIM